MLRNVLVLENNQRVDALIKNTEQYSITQICAVAFSILFLFNTDIQYNNKNRY